MAPTEGSNPGPHPLPPGDLSSRALPLIPSRQTWFRSHPRDRDPLYFGRRGTNRWDAPGGRYGVLYAGGDEHCAFIETFGHDTGTVEFVTRAALAARGLARLEPRRALRLVDLTGAGLARLGADSRLCGGDLTIARRWSQALHEHPAAPDGILYRPRHDPQRQAAALFERCRETLRVHSLGSLAEPEHQALLARILTTYRFGLIESG